MTIFELFFWILFLGFAVKWYRKSYISSKRVISILKKAGLEAESPRKMTKQDFELAPIPCWRGRVIYLPSVGSDCVARIFDFNDVKALQQYYDSIEEKSEVELSRTIKHKNILVQMSGTIQQEKLLQYREALYKL